MTPPKTLRKRFFLKLTLAVVALILLPSAHMAQAVVVGERVASGLSSPVFVTSPPGDTARLFIVEQGGAIKILDLNTLTLNATPFLTVLDLTSGGERGLLGLAFHPDYATNGEFYVHFTGTDGNSNIRRYTVSASDPDIADSGSAQPLLNYTQPQSNHNGGWLGFGPDDFLYIASGDGGGGNDNGTGHTVGIGNSQDITNLLGKILRIDVDGDDFPADPNRNYAIPSSNPFVGITGADEIWAYGLRNPWRSSFDRLTGDFYIGDVGQNTREEINVQLAASTGGENYGWRLREGTIATPTGGVGGPKPPGAIDPIYNYNHGGGTTEGFSVTGGYVYRGPIPSLQGLYFFADYVTERIWSLEFDGSAPATHDGTNYTNFTDWTTALDPAVGNIGQIAGFGEDAAGNLYICDLGGEVFRIIDDNPGPTPTPSSTATITATFTVTPSATPTEPPDPPASCGATPATCDAPGKALFLLKKRTGDPSKSKLLWKWLKGTVAGQVDFGDPTTVTSYALCVYDDGVLAQQHLLEAGGICGAKPCWKALSDKGYRYKNKNGNGAGISVVTMKSGIGKAKIILKGKGTSVAVPATDPLFTQASELRTQLVRSGASTCWEADLATPAVKSTAEQFKDKAP